MEREKFLEVVRNSSWNELYKMCEQMHLYTEEEVNIILDQMDTLEKTSNINTGIAYKESHTFQYVVSFLIPFIGFMLGSLLLAKDSDKDKSLGKDCISLGIASMIVITIILIIIAYNM